MIETELTQSEVDQLTKMVTFAVDTFGTLTIQDVHGDVKGAIDGHVHGDIHGDVRGYVHGDVHGDVIGYVLGLG